ncbi:MAG: hypothetical protein ACRDOY_07300 [Nocardioidaceae bacterium]
MAIDPSARVRRVAAGLTTISAATVVAVPAFVAVPGLVTSVDDRMSGREGAVSHTAAPRLTETTGTAAPVFDQTVTPQVHDAPVRDPHLRGRPSLAGRSTPQPVAGYGVVGATWKGSAPAGMSLRVRTREAGHWSGWRDLPVHDDHGPEPGSAEAAAATRSGSDPMVVGDVGAVQLRAISSTGEAPRDLELNVVDPGFSTTDRYAADRYAGAAAPSYDLAVASASGAGTTSFTTYTGPRLAGQDATTATPVATVSAPKPRIRSRAAWGANERLRSGSPRYSNGFRGAFVHHTVNANGYSRAQVPAIIRGIYAYHTQRLGWSDIGYNFLLDRFGRIWEGRYGGVARHVIGAHTLNYNEETFAMSAIGNFDISSGIPNRRMVAAYGALFGWKLGLDGIPAQSHQWLNGRWLPAIQGHRDVGQTACPGRYLYAKMPAIRSAAAAAQNAQ